MSDPNSIIIQESSIENAIIVHASIPEFDKTAADAEYFKERYRNKKHVIHIAYIEDKPIGYMISYDQFEDDSIYCWMAGVNPSFRERGVLKKLMLTLEEWCKKNNIHTLHIKTSNKRRAMLTYLVKNGFNITEIITYPKIINYGMLLQKEIT